MKFPRIALMAVVALALAASPTGATVEVSGSILNDTTWTSAETIRAVGDIFVAETVRLTIEPGTVVHCIPGVGLTVAGELQADAGTGSRITFTSSADTTDGLPVGGGWTGIIFQPSSTGALRNCDIRYAAYAVNIDQASPAIEGCVIRDFLSVGISFDGGISSPPTPLVIDGCVIEQVGPDMRGTAKAVFGYRKAGFTLTNCRFAHCYYGLEFFGASGLSPQFEVIDCDILDNGMYGIYTHTG